LQKAPEHYAVAQGEALPAQSRGALLLGLIFWFFWIKPKEQSSRKAEEKMHVAGLLLRNNDDICSHRANTGTEGPVGSWQ
jgi:hypothetical protein